MCPFLPAWLMLDPFVSPKLSSLPTLHEMMIFCPRDLAVSQKAVAKLKYSFQTERSSYLGSLSLDVLLLVGKPPTPLRRLNWSHSKNIQALFIASLYKSHLWLVLTTLFTESSSHPLIWEMTLQE